MVNFRCRIAYADNVTLAAFDCIAVVSRRLYLPPHAVLVVKCVDKHVPYLGVAYRYDCSLLLVLPSRYGVIVEIYCYGSSIIVFQHLPEKDAEVFEVELHGSLLLVGHIRPCRYLLNRYKRPTLQLIDSPVLKRKVYRRIEACILLCPLRNTQRHDVFLPLKLYFPVKREVRHNLTVYLYLRGDGFLAHIGYVSRGLGESGVLLPVNLREVKLSYIGYQSLL